MACGGCRRFFAQNIKWLEFFHVVLVFLIFFGFSNLYFGLNNFTSFWTGLLISGASALVFTFGYALSKKIRCSVYIALVQCLGGFGLLMVFLVVGWITIAESLDGVVTNLACVFQSTGDVSTIAAVKFKSVLDILTKSACVIHYTFGLPIVILLFHSFLYVCTYSGKSKKGKNEAESAFTALKNVVNQFKGFLVGVILTMKVCLMLFQFVLCFTLEHLGQTDNIVYISQFRTSLFLIFVGFCFILTPFSSRLLKLRHKVYTSFYGSSSKKVSSKEAGNMVWKKKGKRVSYKDVKSKRRNSKVKACRNAKITHIKKRLSKGEPKKPLQGLNRRAIKNSIEEYSSDEGCYREKLENHDTFRETSICKKNAKHFRTEKVDVVVDMHHSGLDTSSTYGDESSEIRTFQGHASRGANNFSDQESDSSKNTKTSVKKNVQGRFKKGGNKFSLQESDSSENEERNAKKNVRGRVTKCVDKFSDQESDSSENEKRVKTKGPLSFLYR